MPGYGTSSKSRSVRPGNRTCRRYTRLCGNMPGPPTPYRPGVKIRCGGAIVPSVEHLAFFIARCRESRLAWKATAGLHHPLRHRDPASQAMMHGFLNVFLAGVFAHMQALDEAQLAALCKRNRLRRFNSRKSASAGETGAARWIRCARHGRGCRRSAVAASTSRAMNCVRCGCLSDRCQGQRNVWTLCVHGGRIHRGITSEVHSAQAQVKRVGRCEGNQGPIAAASGPEGGAGPCRQAAPDQSQQLHAGARVRGGPAGSGGAGRHRDAACRVGGVLQGARFATVSNARAAKTPHPAECLRWTGKIRRSAAQFRSKHGTTSLISTAACRR